MSTPIEYINVQICNKALYEFLKDYAKRGLFKRDRRFDYDPDLCFENISSLADKTENEDFQIKIRMSDVDHRITPHSIVDVIPCLLLHFKVIFGLNEIQYMTLVTDAVSKRLILDCAFESILWESVYDYYREVNIYRTEEVYEYDRYSEKNEYLRREYSNDIFVYGLDSINSGEYLSQISESNYPEFIISGQNSVSWLDQQRKSGKSNFVYPRASSINPQNCSRDEAIVIVRDNGLRLADLSEEYKSDKEIVLYAIRNNALALQYASNELRNDRIVVLAAVIDCPEALQYASETMQNDRIVKMAIENRYSFPNKVPDELKNNRDLIIALANKDPMKAIRIASPEIKDDKEVAMFIVNIDGYALSEISDRLRSDKDVVLTAVKKSFSVLQYASKELRNDKDVFYAALSEDDEALMYASNELANDKEVVMAAVKQSGLSLAFASYDLRNDKEIVLEAIKQNRNAINFASDEIRSDPDIQAAYKE